MLLPTYNEDPYRIMARLRAMYESVDQSGSGASFDWFVLSDTTDPAIWIAEEKCFLQLRHDSRAANVYYRHRRDNTSKKSGNIEDWITRFGSDYDHMIILDADSLMTGDTIVRLASAMENHPTVALIQNASNRRQFQDLVCQAAAVFRSVVRSFDRSRHSMVARLRRQLLGA